MDQTSSNKPRLDDVGDAPQEQTDAERREVLATIGRFIYVAPALPCWPSPRPPRPATAAEEPDRVTATATPITFTPDRPA